MMTYNYRLMHTDKMRRGGGCLQPGRDRSDGHEDPGGRPGADRLRRGVEVGGRFVQSGFTEGQAKLKAVWENPQIASICSQMPNLTLLMSNVSAALEKTGLSSGDNRLLRHYARETQSDYCAGCTAICEPAVAHRAPIGDIMRCLMYSRSYGNREQARAVFRSMPPETRRRLAALDYGAAESRCPQKLAIGHLVQQAVREFS
ncbi:MAG: hypothetical protein U5R30_15465 [Deltaproteobacteria bacterium]|nr:hypothetical protein [Deltaproteobacteria bacterium]